MVAKAVRRTNCRSTRPAAAVCLTLADRRITVYPRLHTPFSVLPREPFDMNRHFNVAGPCLADEHYMLPAQARCADLRDLIDQGLYFVIHAPRQSGKTTLLQDIVRELGGGSEHHAIYCSLESAQDIKEVEKGIPAVVRSLTVAIKFHSTLSGIPFDTDANYDDFNTVLRTCLSRFCAALDRPLVIMFDEVDCLSNGTMLSFLRQLREGYVNRGTIPFVHSLALVGMRNIRDFKVRIRPDQETLGSASPFNIVAESRTLRNFTHEEVGQLYAQHAEEQGQVFPDEAVERAFYHTQGQPWLVNAIAREIVVKLLRSDFTKAIEPEHVEQAVQNLIRRRDTHIDSLLERLKEERVRRVVQPMITGAREEFDPLDDDVQYAFDLGLVCRLRGAIQPSNPIYSEVIARYLSLGFQYEMEAAEYPQARRYLSGDRLDMRQLLGDFQQFWRENSEIWQKRYDYQEAAPHLILMAFLQNVMNGEGRILREYGTGRGRVDLCVELRGHRYPVELKIRYGKKTIDEGRKQLSRYLERLGCDEGWLIVFDRRETASWGERIFWRDEEAAGRQVHLVGC